MINRKLASIQTVSSVTNILHPVDGSETTLALIRFENIAWQCVAKRGEFQPGDRAVYIEISSIVPDHPVFEFLRSKKFKVKTVRLLGVLSQGLALPVSILPQFIGTFEGIDNEAWLDGADVTEALGVLRPEPAPEYKITGSGVVRPFPVDICPKTDEMRVQSVPFILKELREVEDVVATLKIDGTSATYFWDVELEKLRVCSRNMEKMEDDGSVYFLALRRYPQIETMLRENPDYVLQGEIVAPGIQKNRLGVKDVDFYAFNIYDRESGEYKSQYYFMNELDSYGIKYAPMVHRWTKFDETVESLLELAKGYYGGTNNHREGIVLRPYFTERYSYLVGGRLSCKVINNDYLLGGGE